MMKDQWRSVAARLVFLALAVAAPASARDGQVTRTVVRGAVAAQQLADPQPAPIDLLWRTKEADEGAADTRLFSLVELNPGLDQDGELMYDGRGRVFAPFARRSAFQIEGSYDWYHDRREGQLDIGLVNRVQRVQMGLFSSVRYANLEAFDSGATLAQLGGTLDWLFARGRVGIFGTAPLVDTTNMGRRSATLDGLEEGDLRLVDQFGASAQVDVAGWARLEGHLSFLKPIGQGRTTGGSLRLVYPIAEGWAVTAEGGWNRSFIARSTLSRFTVGVRMGEWPSPRALSAANRPVPVEMPAARHQALVRLRSNLRGDGHVPREGSAIGMGDAGQPHVAATVLDSVTITASPRRP